MFSARRNDYAHASDKQPTISQANSLIEDFIDTIRGDGHLTHRLALKQATFERKIGTSDGAEWS